MKQVNQGAGQKVIIEEKSILVQRLFVSVSFLEEAFRLISFALNGLKALYRSFFAMLGVPFKKFSKIIEIN